MQFFFKVSPDSTPVLHTETVLAFDIKKINCFTTNFFVTRNHKQHNIYTYLLMHVWTRT